MKVDISVPQMGESILEATVGQLLVPSGTQVKAEQEILELETDKLNQVIYAPAAGKIHFEVQVRQSVKIGQRLGFIETEAVAPSENKRETVAPPAPSGQPIRRGKEQLLQELQPTPPPQKSPEPAPPAREAAAPLPPSSRERETRTPLSRLRRVIAERLVQAQRTAAMLTTFNEVDMSRVQQLRQAFQEPFAKKYGGKLGYMPFFAKAVVSALQAYPVLNSYIEGENTVERHYYDLGIAVSSDRGLLVPVVRDCDQLSMGQIESRIEELAKKAREGGLSPEELTGGSFTITNGGVFGSLLSTPIINPPQSAILGMHKIVQRPIALNEEVVIRPMMYLAVSYDHRLIDGREAVRFLIHVKECLEEPARMLLEI